MDVSATAVGCFSMPLISLWQSNPAAITEFTVEQVVATSGDGNLRDGTPCSQELRDYLAQIPSEKITSYVGQCLAAGFNKSGMVLQNLVNELSRRLDYKVSNGRYQGTTNAVGLVAAVVLTTVTALVVPTGQVSAHAPHDQIADVLISPDFATDRTVFAISRNRFMRSTDGGSSWSEIVRGITGDDATTVAVAPSSAQTVYLGTRDNGILRSLDQGSSWQHMSSLVADDIAVSPGSPSIALAATPSGPTRGEGHRQNHQGTGVRSDQAQLCKRRQDHSANMKLAALRKSVRLTPSECRNAAASRRSFSTPNSFM